MQNPDLLRYPVGRPEFPSIYDESTMQNYIKQIDEFPEKLEVILEDISEDNLRKQYRQGSWDVRQIVHHLADSHINAYIRCKLAKTELDPKIKPYDEKKWAEEADSLDLRPEISLHIIKNIHKRWVHFLKSLTSENILRKAFHPESNRAYSIYHFTALYSWHGEHHLEHIKIALKSD